MPPKSGKEKYAPANGSEMKDAPLQANPDDEQTLSNDEKILPIGKHGPFQRNDAFYIGINERLAAADKQIEQKDLAQGAKLYEAVLKEIADRIASLKDRPDAKQEHDDCERFCIQMNYRLHHIQLKLRNYEDALNYLNLCLHILSNIKDPQPDIQQSIDIIAKVYKNIGTQAWGVSLSRVMAVSIATAEEEHNKNKLLILLYSGLRHIEIVKICFTAPPKDIERLKLACELESKIWSDIAILNPDAQSQDQTASLQTPLASDNPNPQYSRCLGNQSLNVGFLQLKLVAMTQTATNKEAGRKLLLRALTYAITAKTCFEKLPDADAPKKFQNACQLEDSIMAGILSIDYNLTFDQSRSESEPEHEDKQDRPPIKSPEDFLDMASTCLEAAVTELDHQAAVRSTSAPEPVVTNLYNGLFYALLAKLGYKLKLELAPLYGNTQTVAAKTNYDRAVTAKTKLLGAMQKLETVYKTERLNLENVPKRLINAVLLKHIGDKYFFLGKLFRSTIFYEEAMALAKTNISFLKASGDTLENNILLDALHRFCAEAYFALYNLYRHPKRRNIEAAQKFRELWRDSYQQIKNKTADDDQHFQWTFPVVPGKEKNLSGLNTESKIVSVEEQKAQVRAMFTPLEHEPVTFCNAVNKKLLSEANKACRNVKENPNHADAYYSRAAIFRECAQEFEKFDCDAIANAFFKIMISSDCKKIKTIKEARKKAFTLQDADRTKKLCMDNPSTEKNAEFLSRLLSNGYSSEQKEHPEINALIQNGLKKFEQKDMPGCIDAFAEAFLEIIKLNAFHMLVHLFYEFALLCKRHGDFLYAFQMLKYVATMNSDHARTIYLSALLYIEIAKEVENTFSYLAETLLEEANDKFKLALKIKEKDVALTISEREDAERRIKEYQKKQQPEEPVVADKKKRKKKPKNAAGANNGVEPAANGTSTASTKPASPTQQHPDQPTNVDQKDSQPRPNKQENILARIANLEASIIKNIANGNFSGARDNVKAANTEIDALLKLNPVEGRKYQTIFKRHLDTISQQQEAKRQADEQRRKEEAEAAHQREKHCQEQQARDARAKLKQDKKQEKSRKRAEAKQICKQKAIESFLEAVTKADKGFKSVGVVDKISEQRSTDVLQILAQLAEQLNPVRELYQRAQQLAPNQPDQKDDQVDQKLAAIGKQLKIIELPNKIINLHDLWKEASKKFAEIYLAFAAGNLTHNMFAPALKLYQQAQALALELQQELNTPDHPFQAFTGFVANFLPPIKQAIEKITQAEKYTQPLNNLCEVLTEIDRIASDKPKLTTAFLEALQKRIVMPEQKGISDSKELHALLPKVLTNPLAFEMLVRLPGLLGVLFPETVRTNNAFVISATKAVQGKMLELIKPNLDYHQVAALILAAIYLPYTNFLDPVKDAGTIFKSIFDSKCHTLKLLLLSDPSLNDWKDKMTKHCGVPDSKESTNNKGSTQDDSLFSTIERRYFIHFTNYIQIFHPLTFTPPPASAFGNPQANGQPTIADPSTVPQQYFAHPAGMMGRGQHSQNRMPAAAPQQQFGRGQGFRPPGP